MFKLSTTVKPDQLGVVLQTLHESGIDPSQVQIQPITSDSAAHQRQPSIIKGTALPGKKRGQKRGYKRDGSIQQKAINILHSFGVGPIALKEIMVKAKAQDVAPATVFRAIKLESAAGRFRKIGKGQYQRTGSGFADSLGVAGNG